MYVGKQEEAGGGEGWWLRKVEPKDGLCISLDVDVNAMRREWPLDHSHASLLDKISLVLYLAAQYNVSLQQPAKKSLVELRKAVCLQGMTA